MFSTIKNKPRAVIKPGHGSPAVIKKGEKADAIMIKGVNIPADIRIKSDKAVVRFKDGGEMIVRVSGVAKTSSKGWTTQKDGDDTVFIKFGKADTLKITG